MQEYKDRIKAAMDRSGMTVTQLASALGMSYQGAKKVYSGESRGFSTPNNIKAARILGVSAEWLGTGNGSMDSQPSTQAYAAGTQAVQGQAQGELSPSAVEIGLLFDMLTDRVERAVAYNAATKAILEVIERRTAAPSGAQGQPGQSKKLPA